MAKLRVHAGRDAGHEFPVLEGSTTIGRAMQNAVVLHDDYAGRRHAEIRQAGEGYTIVDLNSINGTLVNDARITAPQVLQPGDRIQIGETVLVFEEGAVAPAKPEGLPIKPQRNVLLLLLPIAALLLLVIIFILASGPAVTPTVPTPTVAATATFTVVLPTATPVPTRTASPVPAAPATAVPAVLCTDPNLRIISPVPGAEVSGVVAIYGTASIANLAYYKLEFGAGPVPSAWSMIGEAVLSPARDARLAMWDTTVLPAGEYILRLVAVDTTGNYPTPCQMTLHIKK